MSTAIEEMTDEDLEKATAPQSPSRGPKSKLPPSPKIASTPAPVAPIAPTPKLPFAMPDVTVGMTVLWFEHGQRSDQDCPARPAIVTRKHFNSLALNVVDADSNSFRVKEVVRHIDDPTAKSDDLVHEGAWDFTEETMKIRQMMAALGV